MKKLVTIANWARDPLYVQEFRSTVEGFVSEPKPYSNVQFLDCTIPLEKHHFSAHSSVDVLNGDKLNPDLTVAAGFMLSQATYTEERYGRALESVYFVSCDPRIDFRTAEHTPVGSEFLLAKLFSGMYVAGYNSGYVFSSILPRIDKLFTYQLDSEARVYRSRENAPKILAYLLDAIEDNLQLEEAHLTKIPGLENKISLYRDSFGNVVTSYKKSDVTAEYSYGEMATIVVNGLTVKARFVEIKPDGLAGELVLYPGRSGDITDPLMELGTR